jgi:hypothetical protein
VRELTTVRGLVVTEFTYKLRLGLLNTITWQSKILGALLSRATLLSMQISANLLPNRSLLFRTSLRVGYTLFQNVFIPLLSVGLPQWSVTVFDVYGLR